MDQTSGKCSSSGLVLVDCPQSLKVAGSNISAISSMTDFFVALESGWDVKSFLKVLTKALKNLKLGSSSGINQKEIKGGSCMVSPVFLFPSFLEFIFSYPIEEVIWAVYCLEIVAGPVYKRISQKNLRIFPQACTFILLFIVLTS